MERRACGTFGERGSRDMEWQRSSRPPMITDSNHWRRPRSRSPVSYRRPLPVERRHGYSHSYQSSSRPCSYGRPESRGHHYAAARPVDHSSDRRDRNHRSPSSKRPRLEHQEDSRRCETRPVHSPARPSSVVLPVTRAPAKVVAPEPSVTFPELWGTYMTEAMELQLDGWREEARQAQASDPQSARGHSVTGDSSRASSVRSRDGSLSLSSGPAETRAGSKRSHDGQRRESSCAGSWRGGYKRSWDDVQDECPSPAKVFINRDHPRFSRY